MGLLGEGVMWRRTPGLLKSQFFELVPRFELIGIQNS